MESLERVQLELAGKRALLKSHLFGGSNVDGLFDVLPDPKAVHDVTPKSSDVRLPPLVITSSWQRLYNEDWVVGLSLSNSSERLVSLFLFVCYETANVSLSNIIISSMMKQRSRDLGSFLTLHY